MSSELLKGLRMLDLTDEKGALCGKIFADLGVDVIKVEPLGGCATRRIPPFLEDQPGPNRSLYFLAYEAGKRSVVLDLESAAGRGAFIDLAGKSDFLVESYPLGYLDSLSLGYERLKKDNPRLIYTSITPFGDRGPGRDYKAADIVTWAAGGMMYLMGEEDKPPLQMSFPQAGLHAGAEAAVASLIANYARGADGLGQHVVVNMQACVAWTLMNEQAMPILHGNHLGRTGVFAGTLGVRRKMVYQCRDGYVSTVFGAGPTMKSMIDWLIEAGFAADWMKTKDWLSWVPGLLMKATDEDRKEIADLEERVQRFFLTMGKREIYDGALKRRLLIAPVASAADVASDEQLKAREFFVPIRDDQLGITLTMPGAFAKLSATPIGPAKRAPLLGEHDREILSELLGYSAARLAELAKVTAQGAGLR